MDKITLKNVKLRWASLHQPQTKGEFASNKYQVDIVFGKELKDSIEAMKNKKQVIKDLGDGLYSITLKSSKKPKVYDAVQAVMPDDDVAKIGNDTVAHVIAKQYEGFGKAIYLGLQAVKVVKMNEFSSDDFGDDDTEVSSDFDNDDEELI